MKKFFCIFLAIILIILSSGSVYAITPENDNGAKSYTYKFDRDIAMNGVFGTDSFFFNVDKYWKVKDCTLNLVFTQSDLTDKINDTLTVLINDTTVYSVSLTGKTGYKQNVVVTIPADKITAGFNEVKIKTYRRITDKPCADDNNSGNWITIHQESFLHLDFKDNTDSRYLRDYPFPFMKASEETPTNSIILLPDDMKSSEITAAMLLAANLGERRKSSNLNVNIFKMSSSDIKKSVDILYIGKKDDTPPEILNCLSKTEQQNASGKAIIKLVSSPYNKDKKLLAIISNDESSLMKAAKLLSSNSLVAQISSDNYIVDDTSKVDDKLQPSPDKLSFSDLGYSGVTLQGLFLQEASYNVTTEKNKVIKDTAKLSLKFRYSANLDFDKSLITVYINDIPIGSKKLSEGNADDDSIELKIPDEVRNSDTYDIRVSFELDEKGINCRTRETSTPWAYISNESYIYLPYQEGKTAVFENYPNPFIAFGSFNNTVIVIPDHPSMDEINSLANIMAFQGHDLENNTGKLSIIKSSEFNGNYYNDNLIVFGTPNSNQLIKTLNKDMFIKFDEGFKKFISNDKISLSEGYSDKLASLQMLTSPFNENTKLMVITAANEKDLSLDERYLTDFILIKNLKGDGCIIDEDGNVSCSYYNVKAGNSQGSTDTAKTISISSQTKYLLVFFAFILVFIIFITIQLIRKYRK